jgi:hypothetical protein
MKIEWNLALGTAAFLGVAALIYWIWSGEFSGTVLLGFGGAAYSILFGYLLLQAFRRQHIPRVEDRADANPSDGEGEISFFPGNSIWPAAMGLGAVFLVVGLVFGKWFWVIGGAIFLGAIIGFAVEAESR